MATSSVCCATKPLGRTCAVQFATLQTSVNSNVKGFVKQARFCFRSEDQLSGQSKDTSNLLRSLITSRADRYPSSSTSPLSRLQHSLPQSLQQSLKSRSEILCKALMQGSSPKNTHVSSLSSASPTPASKPLDISFLPTAAETMVSMRYTFISSYAFLNF